MIANAIDNIRLERVKQQNYDNRYIKRKQQGFRNNLKH